MASKMTPKTVSAEPIAVEVISENWPIRLMVNREYLPLLRQEGLLEGDALLSFPNHSLVKQHYHRSFCDRVIDKVILGGHDIKAYRKICRHSLFQTIKYQLAGVRNVPHRNWIANLNLAAAGIPVATPIALIEKRSGPFSSQSALLTAELSGYLPLSRLLRQAYLQNCPQTFVSLKQRVADALVRLLGQLIQVQVVNPTLNSKHVFLKQNNGTLGYVLIDVGRSRLANPLKSHHLFKPLSVLHRSIPLELFSRADRLRLFNRVFASQNLHADHKRFIKRIVRKAGQRGFKNIDTSEY
jgi:hypothetical protein